MTDAFRSAVVSARLVHHELQLIHGEVEGWIAAGGIWPEVERLEDRTWEEHKVALAQALPGPDWELLGGAYTWVELFNGEPPADHAFSDEDMRFWESVESEMGGLRSYC